MRTYCTTRPHWWSCIAATLILASACGAASTDEKGRRLPSDEQVVADVMPSDHNNVIEVSTVADKKGEAYLHPRDLSWYFDRGVVVRRKAHLDDLPDVVLVVGGLARYVYNGDAYEYSKFLVNYNEYDGIPKPDDDELEDLVSGRLAEVFVSRDHNVLEVSDLQLVRDERWTWHSPTSFSTPFLIHYRFRTSNTSVEERKNRFTIRFYKQAVDQPIHALMATELDSNVLGIEEFDAEQLAAMKTLRTATR